MRQILIVLLAALTLSSCVSPGGRLGDMPKLSAKDKGSKVTLIRDSSAVGAALITVVLDSKDVLTIAKDEYAEFVVSTGSHTIAVKSSTVPVTIAKPNPMKFIAVTAKRAYFKISVGTNGPKVEPLDAKAAAKLMVGKKKLGS